MSFEDGWAAVNLEMPKRVPRVEFSIERYHWRLMQAVTGIEVAARSSEEVKTKAIQTFYRAWNYDIHLSNMLHKEGLAAKRTNMGHAEWAEDGTDFDDNIQEPFSDPEEVLAFDPWQTYGEIDQREWTRRFEAHCREQKERFPTCVNTTGIYISLITGLMYIFGWEMLLLAAGTDPRRFGELTNRYAAWIGQYYDALAGAEIGDAVVYSHDDMVWTEGAIFHPDWYRQYVFPNLKKLWDPLRESGKKILFTCDGDYTEFIDDIAACGNHGFWFEIFTNLEALAEKYGRTHFLIGNADTRILLRGNRDEIRAEVERCMQAGKALPGYFMSVSNHIPANTPVESALYYNEVYRELSVR